VERVDVTSLVAKCEDPPIQCTPGEEIETTRLDRLNEPQLRLIVDKTVMNPTDVVLDGIIERCHDDSLIEKVVLGVFTVESAKNPSHMRTGDLKGVEPGNLLIDTRANMNVLV
jgi:hypothetical protein